MIEKSSKSLYAVHGFTWSIDAIAKGSVLSTFIRSFEQTKDSSLQVPFYALSWDQNYLAVNMSTCRT